MEFALLVVLETLSPLERAVFVLREAFQFPYSEIAGIIGREEAATRQLARRARDHVRERRPRFETDKESRRRITERFLQACLGGDLDGLTRMLADDATLVADSGGKARSPLRTLMGMAKVGRFLAAVSRPPASERFLKDLGVTSIEDVVAEIAEVNGAPAAVLSVEGRVVTLLVLDVVDDRVQHVYLIANPDKMSRLRAAEPS